MVSLDLNSKYLAEFSSGSDLDVYREFISGRLHEIPGENSAVPRLINYFLKDNVAEARELIREYADKNPDSTTQFIYKDLLIFLLICVATKFNLDTERLKHFIQLRKSDEAEKNALTATFKNILTENYESNDNLYALIIVYKYIHGGAEQDENILNSVIEQMSLRSFPIYESDFLNVTTLRAIELIVRYKGLDAYDELQESRQFITRFRRRTATLTASACLAALGALLAFLIYYSYVYLFGTDIESSFAGKVLTVLGLGLAVVTLLGVTNGRQIFDFLTSLIRKLLGYTSEV